MSENSYTETVTKSFGQNIKDSFVGVIIGIILFVASVLVLWLNEGNCAKQNQIASCLSKNAIPVESTFVDKNNDNKLISTSGKATTEETLTDGILTVPNALVLERKVEMYQWQESKKTKSEKNLGGSTTETTTYSYEKGWYGYPVDSSNFHKTSYVNPPFTLKSERYNAKDGKFGGFLLTETQTSSFGRLHKYSYLPQNPNYTLNGDYYYKSKNIDSPEVGDIRISYEYVPSDSAISVIGMQRADKTISPAVTKQGSVYVQYDGVLSQDEVIEKFKQGNIFTTNAFRLLGFVLMLFGLNLILRPLAVLLSFIPIFEKIVSFLTGGVVFMVSLALTLTVIAIAWLFYRPILTVCLLAISILLVIQIKNKLLAK